MHEAAASQSGRHSHADGNPQRLPAHRSLPS
jgi:hypothetical protein